MGIAGYLLAPRKQPEPHTSDQSSQAITEEPAENGLSRLQRVHFAAPVAVLVFLGWIGVTGLWNDHFIRTFLGSITKNNAGEIRHLRLNSSVTDGGLVHLKVLTNLRTLQIDFNQITDVGLVHLNGLTNLQTLELDFTQFTDAGPAQFRWGLPSHQSNRKRLETSKCFVGGDLWKSISRESFRREFCAGRADSRGRYCRCESCGES
ncbi:MAG: hypothetical protein CMJ59_07240 [Planctomycetaceae bacterium]|nr:hypothetical protein [Planctomycetaceae bacterium]